MSGFYEREMENETVTVVCLGIESCRRPGYSQKRIMKRKKTYTGRELCTLFILLVMTGCQREQQGMRYNTLFGLLPPDSSGIKFVNRLTPDDTTNILTYEYLYNGAGVGVADFNRDGFEDIFLAGSQVPHRLYLNRGKETGGSFSFVDVTETSGIRRDDNWAFGVSVVDINQDGWPDIYVSMGGPGNMNSFPNQLFVHQGLDPSGHPRFKEMAGEYGLADRGQSIQALFFDYDRDGDLDLYLVTGGGFERSPNNPGPIVKNGTAVNTDRLYRNDYHEQIGHPVYTDVSKEAGILQEGYGLGVSQADMNEDGWPDVYVTNDYLTNDQLYINNRDGTFSEKISDYFKHTSHFAMGNDVGDINNDGFMDVIALDMLPDGHYRRKLMFGATQYNKFYYAVSHGYAYQYMRNTLQLNNGNGSFSEIGQLAGIYKTDWSWAPLLADFDNDQYQDIFITNGFGKDVTDLDFVKFRSTINTEAKTEQQRRRILLDSLAGRPGIKVANYAYHNNGDLSFTNVTDNWGFDVPTYSNGAAYADFDNDGDLDLVISNIDDVAYVYRNKQRDRNPSSSNYLTVKLTGSKKNRTGIGSKITVRYEGKIQSRVKTPLHGFQSSMEDGIHFGLGSVKQIDTLEVVWPDGAMSLLTDVDVNRIVEVSDSMRLPAPGKKPVKAAIFEECDPDVIAYRHIENPFIDFNHEPLLPNKLSQEGPGIAVGDVNGDGLEDFFIGAALLRSGKIFLQEKNGTFTGQELNKADRQSEDMGCLLFDADNDNDLDLYIVSGGNEYNPDHHNYQDRLYFNNGKGDFNRDVNALPAIGASGSCVVAADYDHDGDLDLFVGGRVFPTAYPQSPRSYLLSNDGKGRFQDVTAQVCPALQRPGMVASALWTDFDNDGWIDILLAGEYMPLSFYRNDEGRKFTPWDSGIKDSEGWWKSITAGDFDNDGDMDYVAGNFGLNSHYRASAQEPINVAFKDFDNNGALEAITSYYEDGVNYPTPSLDVLTNQLPLLKRKFLYHRIYARTSTENLLEFAGKEGVKVLNCKTLQSAYIENQGSGKFQLKPLPLEMQTAPVFGILTDDVNLDGNIDFLAVGNSYAPDVVSGRCDAFIGQVMLGNGRGDFNSLPVLQSGFFVDGDAKSIAEIIVRNKRLILVGQNDDSLKVFQRARPRRNQVYVKLDRYESSATLTLQDGRQRKVEVGYGSTYLSQSSRSIAVNEQIKKAELFDFTGKPTRTAAVNSGRLRWEK